MKYFEYTIHIIINNNLTLNNKKVITITPNKKNSLIKNSIKHDNKLKKRIVIEHVNLELKRYERCTIRKDKKINNFFKLDIHLRFIKQYKNYKKN